MQDFNPNLGKGSYKSCDYVTDTSGSVEIAANGNESLHYFMEVNRSLIFVVTNSNESFDFVTDPERLL